MNKEVIDLAVEVYGKECSHEFTKKELKLLGFEDQPSCEYIRVRVMTIICDEFVKLRK